MVNYASAFPHIAWAIYTDQKSEWNYSLTPNRRYIMIDNDAETEKFEGSNMSEDDRIREFLKLRAEVQQNPRRIAGVIKKWIAEDQRPKPRKK